MEERKRCKGLLELLEAFSLRVDSEYQYGQAMERVAGMQSKAYPEG